MTSQHDDPVLQLRDLKASIRNIVHDVSNPLGVLRMSAYYLQNGSPDREKVEHYFNVIGENVEKIAAGLAALRELGDEAPPGPPPASRGGDAS